MPRIELPGDNWVDLKDPLKVTQKRRRPVQRVMYELAAAGASKAEGDEFLSGSQLDLLEQFNDLLIVAFVDGWSFEGIEVTVDGLGDLPSEAYDVIQEAVAPLSKEMLPNFDVSPDPKATTSPSSDSPPESGQVDPISPTPESPTTS